MKWPILAATAALCLATVGCDRVSLPFLSKGDADTTAADTAVTQPALDTTALAAAPEPTELQPVTPQREPRAQPAGRRPVGSLVDEPWFPTDTGTVRPGMTRMDVIAVWGEPVVERSAGNRTYLYYRNGCEVTCGTYDVVFLENDQVVDAIVRGRGHNYAGMSSSPPDREAQFTPPVPGAEVPGAI
ncbi:MAG: hypothetical protein JSW43_00025 [Gemmatimonadota bacterium]|nr:MAG: hypothetical protein JSW43_00025 [Gemmatimonadota bacterium]